MQLGVVGLGRTGPRGELASIAPARPGASVFFGATGDSDREKILPDRHAMARHGSHVAPVAEPPR